MAADPFIVGSMIVHNECGRYLPYVLRQLDKVCDEIRIYDDGSTDGTDFLLSQLIAQEGLKIFYIRRLESIFDEDEGKARQSLLDWTMNANPTHVVAIDADEYITHPEELREEILSCPQADNFSIPLHEVWKVSRRVPHGRKDKLWGVVYPPLIYKTAGYEATDPRWRIQPRKLACGREPMVIQRDRNRMEFRIENSSILHLGWTDPQTRKKRYERYMDIDGGEFHDKKHLESIMDKNPTTYKIPGVVLPFTFNRKGERVDYGNTRV